MLQKRPRKFRKGLPEPWDWGERQEAPLFCRETSHRALVATAISCTAQRKGNSWESEVVLVSPSTSSLFMGVAALWSGDLFTRARRFPNKDILIKDETQGNARKKERSHQRMLSSAAASMWFPFPPAPCTKLALYRIVLEGRPGLGARATPTVQSHFLLLDLSFSLPHYPALLI